VAQVRVRSGGGIFNTPAGTVTANDESSVVHNAAASQGGGLYALGTSPANVILWGASAIHLNTPNNCVPLGQFSPCAG
jgi:hypothetical protein